MNPYELLGVNPSDDFETIKSAYRKLIKQYHPDTGHGNTEKIKQIIDAFEQIQSGNNQIHFYLNHIKYEYDLDLELDLVQSITGCTKTIILHNFPVKCPVCGGFKFVESEYKVPCTECNGTGIIPINGSLENCPVCNGSGYMQTMQCPKCNSTGYIFEERQFDLEIEPGIEPNSEFNVQIDDREFYIKIIISNSDKFKRVNNDLHTSLSVNYKDLLDKKIVQIKDPIGNNHDLALHPVNCGDELIIYGAGINGGNIIVKINILMND